jgi:hypothetical protein
VACALCVLVARDTLAGELDRAVALIHAVARLREVYRDQPGLTDALDALLAWPTREGRGHVSDSFWSAWDAFAQAMAIGPQSSARCSTGRDTDTTAAIAGGLAGIYFGVASIPGQWLSGLGGKAVVDPLVDRLRRRLDPRREPTLPAMDPDFTYSMSDLDAIHDHREWNRIHRSGG